MSSEPNFSAVSGKASGAASFAHFTPELARQNIKTLLLANPNFFGTVLNSDFAPVLDIQGDTAYESLGCVGYNPDLRQLRATINIFQSGGYSGEICSNGSQEFVRFYLSHDGGAHLAGSGSARSQRV